ncbi:MAG: bifunctional riboflavin kinase/FAD synthetase [Candidatus Coatesbacteria bacterium]|nr:bifunctional riboflavin kinase/FAD synthetase [Candidatus Coatesbacteria bacterium]
MKYIATIGTFDGIHLGHQSIIDFVKKTASEKNLHSALITFEPYPSNILKKNQADKRLTTHSERMWIFRKLDINKILIIPFDKELASKSPSDFVKMLLSKINIEALVVGYNFCFGEKRSGNSVTLQQLGEMLGFDVYVIPPLDFHNHIVSSSRIRNLVNKASLDIACKLLGYPYSILGSIQEGHGRGREIGFPTANMNITENKLIPPDGVYFGKVHYKNKSLNALINLGAAPTAKREQKLLEAFIIDFKENLYDKEIWVSLLKFHREIDTFSSFSDLKKQIESDILQARIYFNKFTPGDSWLWSEKLSFKKSALH